MVRPAQALARRSEPPPSAATPIAVAPALPNIVHFSVDAYQPDPAFDASLRAHANQLKADPKLHLLLKGHGDALGTVHYNRALAAKRAEMVAKALLGHGVAERQLTQVIGDDDDPNSPEVRRVELIYR